MKANNEFHRKKNPGFVDSEFVKTCHEFVLGFGNYGSYA